MLTQLCHRRADEMVEEWSRWYIWLEKKSLQDAWVRTSLIGHAVQVRSVWWSADGRYPLSGSANKTLGLWELLKGVASAISKGTVAGCTQSGLARTGGPVRERQPGNQVWYMLSYCFADQRNPLTLLDLIRENMIHVRDLISHLSFKAAIELQHVLCEAWNTNCAVTGGFVGKWMVPFLTGFEGGGEV